MRLIDLDRPEDYILDGIYYVAPMTESELKSEAKRLGYKLIKAKPYEKLLPCICGCNRRVHKFQYDRDTGEEYIILECKYCGRDAKGTTERDSIHNWNLMVLGG